MDKGAVGPVNKEGWWFRKDRRPQWARLILSHWSSSSSSSSAQAFTSIITVFIMIIKMITLRAAGINKKQGTHVNLFWSGSLLATSWSLVFLSPSSSLSSSSSSLPYKDHHRCNSCHRYPYKWRAFNLQMLTRKPSTRRLLWKWKRPVCSPSWWWWWWCLNINVEWCLVS